MRLYSAEEVKKVMAGKCTREYFGKMDGFIDLEDCDLGRDESVDNLFLFATRVGLLDDVIVLREAINASGKAYMEKIPFRKWRVSDYRIADEDVQFMVLQKYGDIRKMKIIAWVDGLVIESDVYDLTEWAKNPIINKHHYSHPFINEMWIDEDETSYRLHGSTGMGMCNEEKFEIDITFTKPPSTD